MASVFDLEDEKSIYLIDLKSPEGIGFDTYCFCGYENVTYNGRAYNYLPYLDVQGLSYSSAGVNAEPQITVPATGLVSLWIRQFNDLTGFEVSIKRIKKRNLASTNPLYTSVPDTFVIDSKTSEIPNELVTFKLVQRATFRNQIPGRILASNCTWKKYRGDGCNYAGSMFNVNNEQTQNLEEDVCSLTLEACTVRGNNQNFSGVPTIDDLQ